MLRVTVELISAIDGKRSTLGVMDICNDGSGDSKRGNYYGLLWRKGSEPRLGQSCGRPQRRGSVQNYPRQSYVVWRLVLRMLRDMFPEEKK